MPTWSYTASGDNHRSLDWEVAFEEEVVVVEGNLGRRRGEGGSKDTSSALVCFEQAKSR